MGTSAAKPGELRYGDHIVVDMGDGTYVPAIFLKEQVKNYSEFLIYRPVARRLIGFTPAQTGLLAVVTWVGRWQCQLSVLEAVAKPRRTVWPDPNVGPEFRFSGKIRLPKEGFQEGSHFVMFHQIFDIKDRVRVPGCRITNWYYAESTFEFSDGYCSPELMSKSWISEKRLAYKLDWKEGYMARLAKPEWKQEGSR